MNNFLKWFQNLFNSMKNYLNPNEADPHDDYMNDELYRNRRSVKRRQSTLRESHYLIFGASIIGILVILLGAVSIGHHTINSVRTANASTQVNKLFTSDKRSDIKETTDNKKISQTRVDVKKLHTSTKKAQMLTDLTNATHMVNIRTSYSSFYNSKGLLKSDISVKKVDGLKKSLDHYALPTKFHSKFQNYLKNTKLIAKKTANYDKQVKVIQKDQLLGIPVSSEMVQNLIKKMNGNLKSQKTVTQRKQLVKLHKSLVSEEKAQQAALATQQQEQAAEAAAQQQANEEKAEKKAEKEAEKQQKEAEQQQEQAAAAASESQATAQSQQAAAADSAQQQTNQNQQADGSNTTTDPSNSTGGYGQ